MEAKTTTVPRASSARAPSTTRLVPTEACRVTSSAGATSTKGRDSAKLAMAVSEGEMGPRRTG